MDGSFRNTEWKRDKDQFVHLDIKALNVFLGDELPDSADVYEKKYPIIKLADFGLSQLTSSEDSGNPGLIRSFGTPSYFVPVSNLPLTILLCKRRTSGLFLCTGNLLVQLV